MKFKFANYEDYKKQRQDLYDEAEKLLNEGNVDEANAKMKDMEDMDEAYEAYAAAQANLKAAAGNARTIGLGGMGVSVEGGTMIGSMGAATKENDVLDSEEYKEAFMNFACRGVKIPEKFQDAIKGKLMNAATSVSDTTAVIPTTTMKEIIDEMKDHGELYNRVRKTNVQGGLEIPILSLTPTASWVTEDEASTDQKVQANTKITFSYYGLECKIAQTLLANVVDFAEFTAMFVPMAVEAILSALDKGIIAGR